MKYSFKSKNCSSIPGINMFINSTIDNSNSMPQIVDCDSQAMTGVCKGLYVACSEIQVLNLSKHDLAVQCRPQIRYFSLLNTGNDV